MTQRILRLAVMVVAVMILGAILFPRLHSLLPQNETKKESKTAPHADARLSRSLRKLPLSFEEEAARTGNGKRLVSRGPGYSLGVTGSGASLVRTYKMGAASADASNAAAMMAGAGGMGVSRIQLTWLGANPEARAQGESRQTGVSNYLISADRSKWRRKVTHYGEVKIAKLYPGVDLKFHGDREQLEFDYIVKAGADASAIRVGIGTPSVVGLNENGQLEISDGGEALVLQTPVAYQEIGGTRRAVAARYVLAANHEMRFALGEYDKTKELVIDPVLSFAAQFGSATNLTMAADVAVDGSGDIYLTGSTCDTDYPVTPGALQTSGGSVTALLCDTGVITKLNPTASALIYSTYIGSANNVTAGIRILPVSGGAALVAGVTTALDFPTTANAYQKAARGGTCNYGPFLTSRPCTDGFVLELSADGSGLVFSTFLGGDRADLISALTTDGTGDIYVAGATNSADFPATSGTFQTALGGGTCQGGLYPCFDAFVAKLSSDGSQLLEATLLGGNDDDFASGVVVDGTGNIYLGGTAYSANFPTSSGAYQKTHSTGSGQGDAFVTKLTPDMKTLTYSTFLGGTGFDIGLALQVDSTGAAYIVGSTNSTDFPTTTGSFQTTYAGPPAAQTICDTAIDSSLLQQPSCGDIFVSKLNPAGSALVYSTYIGGTQPDIAFAAGLDSGKNLWILADTASTDFPYTSDAYHTSGAENVALVELSADGKGVVFATPLAEGSTSQALALGLKVDSSDDVYVAGQALQFSPTPGSYSSGLTPSIFVAKFVPGTPRPGVSLSGSTLNFPSIAAGTTSAPGTVTLTNTGTAVLNLAITLNASFQGNPVPFSEYDNCGSTLAAGANCTISAIYQPTSASATDNAGIKIVSDAPGSPNQIILSGSSGTLGAASMVPAALTFAGQGPGTTSLSQNSSLNVPASNSLALLPLVTGAASVSGPNASEFTVDSSACPIGSHFCGLNITFTPAVSATGTRTATVSVPTNAANSPQTVALTGTVSSGPTAVFPFGANFTPISVGQAINTTVVVKNIGGATLNVTNVSTSGTNATEFVPSNTTCSGFPAFTLAAGQSCGLNIAFTPTGHGTRTATLALTDNETTGATLMLSAFAKDATGAAFQLVLTPGLTNGVSLFPDTVVGTNSGLTEQLVGLLNTGNASGTISSLTLTGDFTQTNNCPGVIPAQSSCQYTVSFAPTTTGTRTGALTIVTDASGGQTLSVNFSGNGVKIPQASLMPGSVNFGQQAAGTMSAGQPVVLKNTGGATLTVSNVAIAAGFTQTNNCGSSLAGGASCTFTVKFAPTSVGAASGVLSFTSNAAGGAYAVGLNGMGVTGAAAQLSPTSLTFGNQAEGGTSAPQVVTLSNPGNAALTISGFQASENFKQTNNCGTSLAAGASCTISVSFVPGSDTFPNFPAPGQLFVSTNTAGSPQTVMLSGTPQASTGAATTVTVSASPNPSTVGQSVTLTATVSSTTAGTITGTVTFLDGSTGVGTGNVGANGKATVSVSTFSQGTHPITALYNGDANFAPGTSSGFVQTVNVGTTAATTTTLASSVDPSTVGQSVTFTATVSSTTAGTITGTVKFLDGSTQIGSGTLSGGMATFATNSLSQGTHSITAQYGGDANFTASTSGALTQTVNAGAKAPTTTAMASSVNPSTVGQSVTFTATVSSTTSGTITGTVTFSDGATQLGTGTVTGGMATYTTSALMQGAHSITGQYGGDANFAGSTSTALTQTVNVSTKASTTTALASSANPSTYGQSVTLTATVSSTTAGTITGTVNFLDGATQIGSGMISGGKATFMTSTLGSGSHSLTAAYGGDTNYAASTSGALTQTVNKAATTAGLASSVNPSMFGQSVTLTATVSSTAAGTITGPVSFLDGGTQIGTGSVGTNGQATLMTATLSTGTHALTAAYSGDANFTASTSGGLTQTVNKATTTTTVTSSANPSAVGVSVTFTATVTPSGSGAVTGTVNFLDGATQIGSGSVGAGGVATFATTTLALGPHSITAAYGGDANNLTSTSVALTQTVNAGAPDFSISSSPAGLIIPAGQTGTAMLTVTPINGATLTVQFACGMLPKKSVCGFQPAMITLDGKNPATTTLMIGTTKGSSNVPMPGAPRGPIWPMAALAATMAMLLGAAWRTQGQMPRRALLGAAAIVLALGLGACSGSSGTPTGTYTVAVTATASSGGTAHTVNLTVQVTK